MAIIPSTRKRNVLWPMQRGGKGWSTGVMGKRYTSAVHHLLRTPYGALPWEPTYGSKIHQMRTQSINEPDRIFLQTDLQNGMAHWIPDIVLIDMQFELGTVAEDEKLTIIVTWGIPDASSVANMGEPKFSLGPVVQTITV